MQKNKEMVVITTIDLMSWIVFEQIEFYMDLSSRLKNTLLCKLSPCINYSCLNPQKCELRITTKWQHLHLAEVGSYKNQYKNVL